MSIKILPSVLDVPREDIQGYIEDIEPLVDGISFDVMDGDFVPPTSFTMEEVASYEVEKMKEVHLMVQHPEKWIDDCVEAEADVITVHYEAEQPSVRETLERIREAGCLSSLALKPGTEVTEVAEDLWELVDIALIMSVEPGWGGQSFLEEVLDKVRLLKKQYPDMSVNIDGGVNAESSELAREAGCDYLVSGSFLYKSDDWEEAVRLLKGE
jgi:ribulose-phosphate 3-epimerase